MKLAIPAFWQKWLKNKSTDDFTGISILATTIKVVRIKVTEGEYACTQAAEYQLEHQDLITERLEKIVQDFQLAESQVVLVIPSEKTESVQIDASDLPANDIQASLPWKLKDLVSIAPQDMLCDFIEMKIQPLGQNAKAMIIATSRQYIDKLTSPFHNKKVPILAITTEQFVLARMQNSKDAAQLVFVQHRDSEAILLILKNQEICFARKIRGTDAVVNMSPAQVQEVGADMIAIEIQRSIDYYESQLKQPPIKDALVAIAGNNDHMLVELLNNLLPVKTRMLPIEHIEDESGQLSLAYLASLGAAMYGAHEAIAE